MDQVDREPWDATEPDEMEVLKANLPYDELSGTFSVHVGDDE